jgi:hypothetical protein
MEELLAASCNNILIANVLYTLRVMIIGGGIVFYLSRFLRNRGVSDNKAYWVSVVVFAQIAFWIDREIFSLLFRC